VLKSVGLITAKKSGREQICELAPQGGESIRHLIANIEEVGRLAEISCLFSIDMVYQRPST